MSLCLRPLLFLLVVLGVPTNRNEFLIVIGDNPDAHSRRKELETNLELPRPHNWTRLRRLQIQRRRTMTGVVTPVIRVTCKNVRDELEVLGTCLDNGENDATIPGVDAFQLETACLKLVELPEALAIVQSPRRGASDSNRHSRGSPGGKGKTRETLDDSVHPAVPVISDDDRPAQVVGRAQRTRSQRRAADLQASTVEQTKSTQRLPFVQRARPLDRRSSMPMPPCKHDRAQGRGPRVRNESRRRNTTSSASAG